MARPHICMRPAFQRPPERLRRCQYWAPTMTDVTSRISGSCCSTSAIHTDLETVVGLPPHGLVLDGRQLALLTQFVGRGQHLDNRFPLAVHGLAALVGITLE